jgi:ubiquinone/menaquinone biosynthesis C-methylase UbiE
VTDNLDHQVQRNIDIHNRVARKYEATHGEIFNDVEQARLRDTLGEAVAAVMTGCDSFRALDFGCGSGNLTGHLLALGLEVTAADVAQGFLELVASRYSSELLDTFQLNGRDLSGLDDESFDIVATYSVLHHVPDYLSACREMARVTRKGGVVVIDHEASPNAWISDEALEHFRKAGSRFDWRKYLVPMNYVHRLRRIFDPRYSNEGDIHVWPDDHIEWDRISEQMIADGFEIVVQQDYLLYRKLYLREVYEQYKDRCADTRVMVFRKLAS